MIQRPVLSGVLSTAGERSHYVRTVRRLFGLPDDDLFDEKLEQRLRGFQQVAGLVPNGWLTEHTYRVLCRVKNYSDDRGEATVTLSVAGAVATGLPVAVAMSTFEDRSTFLVSFIGGLIAIGLGVGKFYQWWKRSIETSFAQEQTLKLLTDRVEELVCQIERIEARQLTIKNDIDPLIRRANGE
jgi:hypothetical protein